MSTATIKAALSFYDGDTSEVMSDGPTTFSLTGTKILRNRQTVGTSAEVLIVGDITSPGYAIIKNLDSTNYIEVQAGASEVAPIKVSAGKFCVVEFTVAAPYVIADTASVEIEYLLLSQ